MIADRACDEARRDRRAEIGALPSPDLLRLPPGWPGALPNG